MQGDRTSEHPGLTARKDNAKVDIVMDAELKDLDCCSKVSLFMCVGCSIFDKPRSYLFLRENSIESNCAFKPCCGICRPRDHVSTMYFDREPFVTVGCCAFCGSEGYCKREDQPKFEVLDTGCLVCCQLCCTDIRPVIMPFENLPFPCCCCVNRVGCCTNCCGMCGQPTGNPVVYKPIYPFPVEAEKFVELSRTVTGLTGGSVSKESRL